MNKLELIISGNLTGFSRFFVTSGANDLLKDAKIDFDYRNFVSFMEEGDKTYAVSFAPQVIALSLVSRTLDSFRRPGILVVSLLLPRNTKVESINNPQNEQSIYQLLNAINDKFNEKNLHNGMLNQNPIVLMQDYYTEILANYRLVQDYQRGVNLTIDNSTFNKNVGYVNSSEKDIVAYLNTPCRRAYEGYHSIFVSPKAPQNIDEPVRELKLYNVYVKNTNQRLTNVTIDSVIQAVFPKRGEIDNNFPKEVRNLTYRQILDGQGGKYIGANITGDTINLVYHFEKETKQVTFQIIGENGEIDFSHVTLVVQNDDGTFYNIPNNPYIFKGEEIYKAKTLNSGDNNYTFSQTLELNRIPQDKGIVCVKISTMINHQSDNSTEKTMPTSIGNENTPVVNVHKSVDTDNSLTTGGIFSNSVANNYNKDKKKTNPEILKILIPLIGLWLVLGGIYAAWTYFSKNSELTNIVIPAADTVNKTVDFYIADTGGQHGEVSDSLQQNVYDKLGNNNIILEMTTSINDNPVINTLKSGMSANDTILYAIEVKGNTTDTLKVNLKVKWNGGQETVLLEEQRSFLLSDLVKEKYTIQLPVAFSELIFYNNLKKSTYKDQNTYDRINAIKDKDEILYHKMMDEYQMKIEKTIAVENNASQVTVKEKPKLKKEDIFDNIRNGYKIKGDLDLVNETNFDVKTQTDLVSKWNSGLEQKNASALKDKAKNIRSWAELSSIFKSL